MTANDFNQLLENYEELITQILFPLLTINMIFCLSKINHAWNKYTQPNLNAILLEYVLKGNEHMVQKIIVAKPARALIKTEAKDFSGRLFKCSPIQAALRTGDAAMLGLLKSNCNDTELKRECNEIFPTDLASHLKEQKCQSFNFEPVLTAIAQASQAEVHAALNQPDIQSTRVPKVYNPPHSQLSLDMALECFRDDFSSFSEKEEVFNPQHLLTILKQLENEIIRGKLSTDTLGLIWCQVLGFVQRFIPAWFAQAFASGLHTTRQNNYYYPRSFLFKHHPLSLNPDSYYPLKDPARIGLNCAVVSSRYLTFSEFISAWRHEEFEGQLSIFQNKIKDHMQHQHEKLITLMSQSPSPKLGITSCHVLGLVQRFIPAWFTQTIANGLLATRRNKYQYPRSFLFKHHPLSLNPDSYYPLASSARIELNCAVNSYHMYKPFPEFITALRYDNFRVNLIGLKNEIKDHMQPMLHI